MTTLRHDRTRRLVALAVVTAAAVSGSGLLAGCARDEFPDRTARVTIRGHVTTFHLDACGLDHQTAFVVGRADDGSVLQAVVGVRRDHTTGVPASTGLSVIDDPNTVAAFGAESWQRRGKTGTPPGSITSARIRGSRIQVGAMAQPEDSHDQPTESPPIPVQLDARCDQRPTPH